jgi:serine/threonine protein phosphatase PrpC
VTVTEAVIRCPNPDCRETVAPSDQYCEVCGQAIRLGHQDVGESGLEAVPAPPPEEPASNGDLPREPTTKGLSRARDHVEVSLPGVAGVSDRGLGRARNEDAVRVGRGGEPGAAVLVVCDGVSSSASAALASQVAADAAVASLMAALEAREEDLEAAMTRAIGAARDAVSAIPYRPWAAKDPPSSTLVAAAVRDTQMTIGWVGDSRAYFLGVSRTWQLSWDDTWAADQVALGRLSENQAASDPRGRFLTKWLGGDQEEGESGLSVRTFEIESAGLVLLCTDGLWNYLASADRLGEMVKELGTDATPMMVARSLTDFARDAGGHDNITVAVAAVSGTDRAGGDRGGR